MTSTIDKLFNYVEKSNQYAEEAFNNPESEIKLQQLLDELYSKKQEHTEAIEQEILELKAAGKDINPYDQNTEGSLLHFVMVGLLDTKLLQYFTANDIKAPNDLLATAIWYGNLEAAKWLLDNGVSSQVRDEDGNTMLELAFWAVNPAIFELLIEKGADINAPDLNGYTILDRVASIHSIPNIQSLIQHGAEVTPYAISQVIYSDFQNETIKSQALLLMLGSSQGIKIDLSSDLIYQFFTNNHNIKALFAIEGYEAQKAIAKENILTSFQEYGQAYNDQNALDMAQLVSSQEIEGLDTNQDHDTKLSGDFEYDSAKAA